MNRTIKQLSPRSRKIVGAIAGGLFTLLGAYITYSGIHDFSLALRSSSWPKTTGVVEQSNVSTSRSTKSTTHTPVVHYRYQVGETTYTSSRIGFYDYGSNHIDVANACCSRYPTGASIVVYYSAESPDVSVLEPGFAMGLMTLPFLGCVFVGVGLLAIVLPIVEPRLRSKKEQPGRVAAPSAPNEAAD